MRKLLLVLLLLGCEPPTPKPPPQPVDTDKCDDAEVTLERLQCRDSTGSPMWVNRRGERFQETCRIAQEEASIFIDPACVASATTCEGANECPTMQH